MIGLALVIVAAAVLAVARGFEVRATLLGAALLLGTLAGNPAAVVREFLSTFAAERFVLPICSAMGFAFVLRETGCDRALIRVLLAPVKQARVVLVPAVVLVGCTVNVPVISQASTAVCLGAVAVPLMRAASFSPVSIGATLLLGASIGGELLNPGAPELASIRDYTGGTTRDLVPHIIPVLLVVVAVAIPVHWWLTIRAERQLVVPPPAAAAELGGPLQPSDFLRALVPAVPLVLLFAAGPPLNLAPIPPEWLIGTPPPDPRIGARLVGLAMLAGVLAAAVTVPARAGKCLPAFFAGAGHGFTAIVSLIVTATCFGKGVELAGLSAALGESLSANPGLVVPAAAAVSGGFALVCGSGMATTQSLYGFFHGPAAAAGLVPADVGAMVAVAAAAGRTMSPVAAVVLTCASLSGTTPGALSRRVAIPLMSGVTAAVILRVLGVI